MMAGKSKTMPAGPLSVVIQHLLADLGPDGSGATDGELLARFLRGRDDAALAALVRRHASMVWGVCRHLLDHHDAEDAFQATFLVLVLVRKAGDVPGRAVAGWLYGVARQTAVRVRATTAKRGRREAQVAVMPEPAAAEARDADLRDVLDEELARLPDHYRGVVVLCDLEGMTRREAARQLGIPEGSVASRLARARALLAKRLTRRGVAFSGGVVTAVLPGSVSASAPSALVGATTQTASRLAAGPAAGVVSAEVAALTEGVVQAMFVTKSRGVLAVGLVAGLTLGGIGVDIGPSTSPVAVAGQPGAGAEPDGKAGGEKPKTAKKQPDVLTPEEAVKQMSKDNVTVQFKVASVEVTPLWARRLKGRNEGPLIRLEDGNKFSVLLSGPASSRIVRLGIDTVRHFGGKRARITGRVSPDPSPLDTARLEAARAELGLAEIELEQTKKLVESKITTQEEVALYEAKLVKARAQAALAEAEFAKGQRFQISTDDLDQFEVVKE